MMIEFKNSAALACSLILCLSPLSGAGAYQVALTAGETESTNCSDKLLIAKKDKDNPDEAKSEKKHRDKDADKDAEKTGEKDKSEPKEAKDGDKAVKTEASAADEEKEKKKGGGLFHLGGKHKDKEEPDKAESKSEAKGEAVKKDAKAATPAAAEDPNKPKFKFDPALISVLKDINKTLKDSEAVTKLEDPAQKLVARLIGDALEKGLAAPDLQANRIVDPKDKERLEKIGMVAEAWESGSIDVSPELKASVAALWAKRIDGLITVEIVGSYDGKVEGAAEKLGEFIAVITARSTVDKGFDIQSQQDVNFWIGKVSDLKIDCTAGKPSDPNLKSMLKQYVPITQRKREFLLALKQYEDKLARAEEDRKKQVELTATQKVAEALAKTFSEALAKSVGSDGKRAGTDKIAAAHENAGGNAGQKKSEGTSDVNAANGSEAPAQNQFLAKQDQSGQSAAQGAQAGDGVRRPAAEPESARVAQPPVDGAAKGGSLASLIAEPSRGNRSNWESPAAPTAIRNPSPGATIIYPTRAVAGQYLTVSVASPQNTAEQFVGLTFNGAQLSTGDNGKVVYQVPEDMPPGFSLRVGLSARPEEPNGAIEVLQPLSTMKDSQMPTLEAVSPVCRAGGLLTVSGHNFEGIAERNRVIVDGAYDATVVVSSPVQLKAQLPPGIPAGPHTLCVSTAGLRSNPGNFDLVSVDLSTDYPDARKLIVKVVGTQYRVRVKLVNQRPDVLRIIKGDEVVVVTSGGSQNQAQVLVQRVRPGAYKVSAEILL